MQPVLYVFVFINPGLKLFGFFTLQLVTQQAWVFAGVQEINTAPMVRLDFRESCFRLSVSVQEFQKRREKAGAVRRAIVTLRVLRESLPRRSACFTTTLGLF